MGRDAKYFRIGMFVIATVAVTVAGMMILGAGSYFEEKIYAETYMDGSVQGLELGAPVKYRGVEIGKVDRIEMLANVYDMQVDSDAFYKYGRYVYIRMAIESKLVRPGEGIDEMRRTLRRLIDDGIRVRMSLQGLTGYAYMELEYLNPKLYPTLDISWTPRSMYIPSAQDTFSRLFDSLEKVFANIEKVDIARLFEDVNDLVVTLNTILKNDVPPILANIEQGTKNLPQTLKRVDRAIERIDDILASAQSLVASDIRPTLQNINAGTERFPEAMERFENLLGEIDTIAEDVGSLLNEELTPTLGNVRAASEDLPSAVANLKSTIRKANVMVATGSASVGEILETLRAVMADLRKLTEAGSGYPSHVLFGDAPPKTRPGVKP